MDTRGKLTVEPEDFSSQMALLKRLQYKVVTLDEAIQPSRSGKRIAITFDDGYKDTYSNALPILSKYKFPATFFIVADYVGKNDSFNRLPELKPTELVDLNDLKELLKCGMTIGSHSMTHANLCEIDEMQLKNEVHESKQKLESLLKINLRYFAYPKGLYNKAVTERVKLAGYQAAFSTRDGDNMSLFTLKRISVSYRDRTTRFLYKLLKRRIKA